MGYLYDCIVRVVRVKGGGGVDLVRRLFQLKDKSIGQYFVALVC